MTKVEIRITGNDKVAEVTAEEWAVHKFLMKLYEKVGISPGEPLKIAYQASNILEAEGVE